MSDTYTVRCTDCRAYIISNMFSLESVEKWAISHAARDGHRVIIRKRRPRGSEIIGAIVGGDTLNECQT